MNDRPNGTPATLAVFAALVLVGLLTWLVVAA